MWYGASAPAPACKVSPLHRGAPGGKSERRLSRASLHRVHSAWGPLVERRLLRDEERRRSRLCDRMESMDTCGSKSISMSDAGAVFPRDMSTRPSTSNGCSYTYARMMRKFSLPTLCTRRPSSSAGQTVSSSLSRASHDRPAPGGSKASLLLVPPHPSSPANRVSVASTESAGSAGQAPNRGAAGHRDSERLHRVSKCISLEKGHKEGSMGKLRRDSLENKGKTVAIGHTPSDKPRRGSGTFGRMPSEKHRRGSGSGTGQREPGVLKTNRRNSFCDKLLEAKLKKKSPDEKKRLLLEGGRRIEFQQQVSRSQNKDQANKVVRSCFHGGVIRTKTVQIDRILPAFRAIACSGVVTVGAQLAETLWLLGHPYPDHGFLDWIIHTECAGRESIDVEDFRTIVTTYEERLAEQQRACFRDYAGEDEHVSVSVIPSMLRDLGVPLMTGIEEEFRHMTAAVDYQDFESIYEDIVSRAGLTQEEHDRLRLIFEELEGLDGTINSQELLGALSWHESLTDLAGGPGVITALVEETLAKVAGGRMSIDPSAWTKVAEAAQKSQSGASAGALGQSSVSSVHVNGHAFLAAASVLHGRITAGLHTVLARLKLSLDKVPSSTLLTIFEELGVEGAVGSDVDSFLLACKFQDKSELTYFEFFTIIFRYCQADGVTEAESKDINAVFVLFDDDQSGTLEASEIGPIIRWLGYQPTQYRVYDFMEEIGVTSSSHVDALEFRRLVAKYKSTNLKNVRKAFLHKDRAADNYRIPVQELTRLLNMVGYDPTHEEVIALAQHVGGRDAVIDFHDFKQLELLHRREVQQAMARNSGFTDGELERHHMHFSRADPNCRGVISGQQAGDIFLSIFPDTSKDCHRHSFILRLLKVSSIDAGSSIDFEEFIALMKTIQEEIDRDMLIQSLALKQEIGYNGTEVKQLHDVFIVSDTDESGDLSFEELCDMLTGIKTLDNTSKRELMALVMEVGNEERRIDFWGFLYIIHKVQTGGLRNLNNWRNVRPSGVNVKGH